MTQSERQQLDAERSQLSVYGCVLILSAGPVWGLGLAAEWVASVISPELGPLVRRLGWGSGALVTAWVLCCFYWFRRSERRALLLDLEESIVEEYSVSAKRVVMLNGFGNRVPNFAFDIGDKVLVLSGQWLTEPSTYGATYDDQAHESNATLNGLAEPKCFPNSRFELVRVPNSGRVLSILPSGVYMSPEAELTVVERGYQMRDSDLFDCNLPNLRLERT